MAHAVSRPTAPFLAAGGRLEVCQVPAAQDNLIWVVIDPQAKEAAAVDGPDAAAVLDYCGARGVRLTAVLNTHTHFDHVGINADLERRGLLRGLRVVGAKATADAVPGLTEPVDDGSAVQLGPVEGQVLLTEGHMNGHISFVFDDLLFCGDTLFAGGCGRVFDGPAEKMHASLERLAALPESTRVCCAHEYTQDNLRFAWSVEPDNEQLAARIREVWATRASGGSAVPSTVGAERATNPFLRGSSLTLRRAVASAMPDARLETAVEVFRATRALKDRGDHRRLGDEDLPL